MVKKGIVYAVGIGPGDESMMTIEARRALEDTDVICGYNVYVDLVAPLFPDKETYSTGMMKEIDRCAWAVDKAAEGNKVAVVCSGDSGVYGMASLLMECAEGRDEVEIVVVPGITAAISGAAVLGAPVSHDFCVVSLSDLMTPWELIEKRIRCAAEADFIMCIYNPRSKKRADYLRKACDIMLRFKSPKTVCGWVRNIGRDGEEMHITTLDKLGDEEVDMFTTVFVGNAATRVCDGKMLTPRGYTEKYKNK